MLSIHPFRFLLSVLCIAFVACSDQHSTSAQPSASDTTTATMEDMSSQDKLVKPVRPSMDFSSVIEYAMDNDTLSMWGTLCKYSKWGKEVHNGNYTLLCPPNKALMVKDRAIVAALKDPKNVDILNKLMAKHLLKNVITDKDLLADATTNEDASGKKVEVSAGQIAGTKYRGMSIYTQHGTVVVIDDVIDFPQAELEARLKKTQK